MVAVPLWLSVNVMPLGSAPVSVSVVAVGYPAAVVTVKLWPARSEVKVAVLALVMVGGALTVSVKLWVALVLAPLLAVMVMVKAPATVGVPAMVAVPLWLSVKVTPAGSVP